MITAVHSSSFLSLFPWSQGLAPGTSLQLSVPCVSSAIFILCRSIFFRHFPSSVTPILCSSSFSFDHFHFLWLPFFASPLSLGISHFLWLILRSFHFISPFFIFYDSLSLQFHLFSPFPIFFAVLPPFQLSFILVCSYEPVGETISSISVIESDVSKCIDKIKENKSPGPDTISPSSKRSKMRISQNTNYTISWITAVWFWLEAR